MRESCIQHRKGERCVVIRSDYLELLEDDQCAAILLAYFEYLTNGELANMESAEQTGLPWVRASLERIGQGILGRYKDTWIRKSLDRLIAAGFLREEQSRFGVTKCYLLEIDHVNRRLEQLSVISESPSLSDDVASSLGGGDSPVTVTERRWSPSLSDGDLPATSSLSDGANKKEYIEEENSKEVYSQPGSSTETQTTTPTQTQAPDLDLEDDPVTFVRNAYSRVNRRAKLPNLRARSEAQTCERIREVEASAGPVEFRTGLIAFLESEGDWLREHRWPIHAYLKDPSRYELAPLKPRPAACETRYWPGSPSPTVQHPPVDELPQAAREWNRIVTAGPPVEQWTHRDRYFSAAAAEPDFLASLPKVLELCQKAYETRPEDVAWLNFRWLLQRDKTSGNENWYKLATGQSNWLFMKPGANRSAGSSTIDSLLKKFQQKAAKVS